MKIGFLYEVHSPGLKQFLKTVDKLREVVLTVLNKRTRKTIGDTEFSIVLTNQVKQQIICRKITFVGYFFENLLVEMLVKICGMDIPRISYVKDRKMIQPKWLVHLEIETYRWHITQDPCRPEAFVLRRGPR
jgi:hypothetical protein